MPESRCGFEHEAIEKSAYVLPMPISTSENSPMNSSIIGLGLAQVVCGATQKPLSMNRTPISEVSVEPSGLSYRLWGDPQVTLSQEPTPPPE
jgi:hypothetical protein